MTADPPMPRSLTGLTTSRLSRRLFRERLVRESPLLRGWGEIAAFLRHSEKTVRIWARTAGLPVHKASVGEQVHAPVIAYRPELERWFKRRYLREPFLVPEETAALSTTLRLRRYRSEVDRVIIRLNTLRLRLKKDPTPIPTPKLRTELDRAVGTLQSASLRYATRVPD